MVYPIKTINTKPQRIRHKKKFYEKKKYFVGGDIV